MMTMMRENLHRVADAGEDLQDLGVLLQPLAPLDRSALVLTMYFGFEDVDDIAR